MVPERNECSHVNLKQGLSISDLTGVISTALFSTSPPSDAAISAILEANGSAHSSSILTLTMETAANLQTRAVPPGRVSQKALFRPTVQKSTQVFVPRTTATRGTSHSAFPPIQRHVTFPPPPVPSPLSVSAFPPANNPREAQIALLALQHTNAYRASNGLSPLVWDERLAKISREHTMAMSSKTRAFGHDGVQQRFNAMNRFRTGENVGMNRGVSDPAQSIVTGWIHSPTHRVNLLGDYNYCGITVTTTARGEVYFTQLLSS